jgi:hypothetical protein
VAQRGGPSQLIVGDVVDLEGAAVDVAQHEIGRTGCVYRRDARELPIQTNRADEVSVGELIVVDVVHFQPTSLAVAQQQVGFAEDAAEIPHARELPIEPDRADEGGVGDLDPELENSQGQKRTYMLAWLRPHRS